MTATQLKATPVKEAFVGYMPLARYMPLGRRQYKVDDEFFTGEESFPEGTFRYYKGWFHGPENLPSIELLDGHCEKHKFGVLHCCDGPAVFNRDGSYAEWYMNGKLLKVRLVDNKGRVYEHSV